MSYFSEWNQEIARVSEARQANAFVEKYYKLEQAAYEKILSAGPDASWSGSFSQLQEELGFNGEPQIFAGFLEGISTSLKQNIDLDALQDETPVHLEIDFEKLLYNMHDAKASWLYDLEAWNHILPVEKRQQIAKQYRVDHTAVSTKVGRNDPCPCGSGKKYKTCCGKVVHPISE